LILRKDSKSQQQSTISGSQNSFGVEFRLQCDLGAGRPLPSPIQHYFEPRFGYDFSKVRIYTEPTANRMARAMHAKAFTLGSDIAFDRDQFDPASHEGRRLLAHELTHVAQTGDVVRRGASTALLLRGTAPANRVQRQLCEDPAEIVRSAIAPQRASGGGQAAARPAVTGENLTPEQFEQMTGVRANRLPENTFIGANRLGSLSEPESSAGSSLAKAAGPAAVAAPLPMSVIPANSIGILWSFGHQSIFANVDGKLTIRGYRANLLTHGGEILPGPVGRWFTGQLLQGVPGGFRGDLLFTLFNNQSAIYLETDGATSAGFASEIRTREYGGTYRYSPPRPDAPPGSTERLMYEKIYRARGAPRAVLCANNCSTVPLPEMETVLGMHPGTRTPQGWLDIATGRSESGEFNPYEQGRASRMREFMRQPELARGRPGLVSLNMTPAAARAVGYIRVGGSILMIYGLYQTASRIGEAWDTEELPLVITSEALSWTGGIVGTAVGTAAASALVCSPTGPVTVVCAAGGFLGGLIVGGAAALLGSLIVPVLVRSAEALSSGIVGLLRGLSSAVQITSAIGHSMARGLILVPLLSARQSVNPCNWELIGLTSRTRADIMALGLYLWNRLGRVNLDTFAERAMKPIYTQGTVPRELLRDIAAGLSAAVRAQSGFNLEFTAEFVGGISPIEFVRQLYGYNLLRYRYDPQMLAELTVGQ
jgi:hypothetical protein